MDRRWDVLAAAFACAALTIALVGVVVTVLAVLL